MTILDQNPNILDGNNPSIYYLIPHTAKEITSPKNEQTTFFSGTISYLLDTKNNYRLKVNQHEISKGTVFPVPIPPPLEAIVNTKCLNVGCVRSWFMRRRNPAMTEAGVCARPLDIEIFTRW